MTMIVSIVGMLLFAWVIGIVVFVVFKKGAGNMKATKEGFEFTKEQEEKNIGMSAKNGWKIRGGKLNVEWVDQNGNLNIGMTADGWEIIDSEQNVKVK